MTFPTPSIPYSATAYTITYSYAGDSNFTSASDSSKTLTVNKATPPVTTWPTASAIAYGQTLASSTLSGGAASVAGTFAWTTATTAPGAGTAAQSVTFTPTDTTNYNPATGTASVTVAKATVSVTTWPTASSITYGQTLASSTLSGGSAPVSGTFAWTTPSTAPGLGTASQSVTFTPTDTTNYNPATGTVSVTVNKAAASLTLSSSINLALVGNAVTSRRPRHPRQPARLISTTVRPDWRP